MVKVVLIGDSIRMGYQPFVAKALEHFGEVWGPAENGGTSSNVLAHLDAWVINRQPDVAHINAGLHDIRRWYDGGYINVPLDTYLYNLETIFRRVKSETKARLVWATTTPVHEAKHNGAHEEVGDFERYNVDLQQYNTAARALAEKMDVEINDLYQLVTDNNPNRIQMYDGVHFKDEGNAILSKRVADIIKGGWKWRW
ncbi:MAG: hypothetical protein FJ319_06365 [SAR202 cluster bacterium]|nr:hypothetical protein [SAR202 cluster bacterium]